MTENKRYVRILDYSEKEVRIFDEHNQKNIFNIFFEGIDSAICLKGALEDTVDLLNYFYEEKKNLVDENGQLKDALNQRTDQCDNYYKENEQLKKEYREMEIKVGKLKGEIGELFCENEQLKQRIKELEQEIEKLDTFKKILEYAEKESDRVDWQSYCEKEFEGL